MPGLRRCLLCQTPFTSTDRRRKFCGLECCWNWRRRNKDKLRGTFKSGIVPWNTGTKGVMKLNSGSYQRGRTSEKREPVGAVKLRRDKDGGRRAWVKVAESGSSYDWVLRAVMVWEKAHGPVPAGSVVHHKNRNKLDDRLVNLELQTRAEHLSEHRPEFERKRSHAAANANRRRHANRANREGAGLFT